MSTVTKFTVEESQAIVDKRVFWRLLFLPAMFAGFSALFFGWPSNHPAVVGTLWVITAYMMFCGTSCLHEAVHQTLWPNKQASIVMGRFIGTFVLVPYTVYRETHIYHHAYLNRPEDWELWPYSDPNCSLWFRRLFVWFDLLMGWLATPLIFSRIYFSKRSPLRKPSIRRVIRNEYLLIVLYWTSLIGIVVALGYGRQFAWAVLPPCEVLGFLWTVQLLIFRGKGWSVQWPKHSRKGPSLAASSPRSLNRRPCKCCWMAIPHPPSRSDWDSPDPMRSTAGSAKLCNTPGRRLAHWGNA